MDRSMRGNLLLLTICQALGQAANTMMFTATALSVATFYEHPDRIRTPLIRRNGALEPATWDEAYDFIAQKLRAIRAQ